MSQYPYSYAYRPYQPYPTRPQQPAWPTATALPQQTHKLEFGGNVLHDSPLRYWGYVNEFAETGKDLLQTRYGHAKTSRLIDKSYTVVKAYVGVDAAYTALKGYQQAKKEGYGHSGRLFSAAEKGVDAGLFQMGASLYGPAFIIATFRDVFKMGLFKLFGNKSGARAVAHEVQEAIQNPNKLSIEKAPEHLKQQLFKPLNKVKPVLKGKVKKETAAKIVKYVPLASSLALIPLLVHPIDSSVHKVLDLTYRPLMKSIKHGLFGKPKGPIQVPHQGQTVHQPTFGHAQYQASFPMYQPPFNTLR